MSIGPEAPALLAFAVESALEFSTPLGQDFLMISPIEAKTEPKEPKVQCRDRICMQPKPWNISGGM